MTTPRRSDALAVLDDGALRRWLFRARDDLGRHRGRIDALNVYPVPDGDTGTNLFLTLDDGVRGFLEALMDHARSDGGHLGVAGGAAALARASLFAARGNSGVILSQLIAGLAAELARGADAGGLDGPGLARALDEADRRGRAAVSEPVEGTILTVMRAAARAAQAQVDGGDATIVGVVEAARRAAHTALARTPDQLPALARAGVVDAGGAGLVLLLDALSTVVRDEPVDEDVPPWLAAEPQAPAGDAAVHTGAARFEVMYLLDHASDAGAGHLTRVLTALGDSVVVAGDRSLRTVHVHTDDPGAAVEAGVSVGRPYAIRITPLPADVDACARPSRPDAEALPGPEASGIGLVACVQAPDLTTLFTEVGAVVVADGPGMRVTPADLVAAARTTRARQVVVLPDDGDALLAADAARGVGAEEGIDLVVVPTRHLLQGLAALAVYDPADPGTADRMRAAADGVRCGFVATATRAAATDAGPCRPGDHVGFVEDRIVHVGQDRHAAALAVLTALGAADAELVTLVEGVDAAGAGAAVRDDLEDVEVEVLSGGQAVYDLLIGVE